jgi:hypothetical protein
MTDRILICTASLRMMVLSKTARKYVIKVGLDQIASRKSSLLSPRMQPRRPSFCTTLPADKRLSIRRLAPCKNVAIVSGLLFKRTVLFVWAYWSAFDSLVGIPVGGVSN